MYTALLASQEAPAPEPGPYEAARSFVDGLENPWIALRTYYEDPEAFQQQ